MACSLVGRARLWAMGVRRPSDCRLLINVFHSPCLDYIRAMLMVEASAEEFFR